MPICTEADKPFVSSCGAGHFPEQLLASTRSFEGVVECAVRVANPVILTSPINIRKDDVGTVTVRPSSARPERSSATAEAKVTEPKMIRCFKCGANDYYQG